LASLNPHGAARESLHDQALEQECQQQRRKTASTPLAAINVRSSSHRSPKPATTTVRLSSRGDRLERISTVVVAGYCDRLTTERTLMAASGVLAVIPPLLLAFLFQRLIVQDSRAAP